MAMIKTENLSFGFNDSEKILNGINLEIEKGSYVAVLGRNGSGKSTLLRHFNAILLPSDGAVYIDGIDTRNEEMLFDVRSNVGMVFQNPDNQIVAAAVEDDVAFAPENLGIEPREIRRRVDMCLDAVGMREYAQFEPSKLSGGQKQRVAIAGILAMQPKCIVFDEATAMLDPKGRAEVMDTISRLNKENGITIVFITHYMEEAAAADRVIVLDNGVIAADGSARRVFSCAEKMEDWGLGVPQITRFAHMLKRDGIDIPTDVITTDECAEAIARAFKKRTVTK